MLFFFLFLIFLLVRQGATSFMTAKLNFPDAESAKKLRNKYFHKYHSTAKALTVAEAEGQLPIPEGWPQGKKFFDPNDLSEWWAEHLNFDLLGEKDLELIEMLETCPLKMVAFSNGPRKYVLRVLREMGLDHVFPENRVFAVNDVLPACKPEKEAFEKVFDAVGIKDPSECIMVEGSMKNIRAAKGLGMSTLLIAGMGRLKKNGSNVIGNKFAAAAEATKAGDAPDDSDPAVDVCIEHIKELKSALPGLWDNKRSLEN
jgi:haloacid dehalogenase superfamily, subfamily IA, variant 3 with third motif having DD or ED